MGTETSFQKLGLGEYESKALAALISHHDATAEIISDSANIPYTKIYQILNALEKQGLIKSTLERPKKYRPMDPENIFDSIIQRKKDEVKEMEKELKTDFKTIKKEYEQGEAYQGKEKVWYIPNEKAVYDNIANFLKSAKKQVIVCVDRETWITTMENERVIKTLNEMDKRGVRSRGIIPTSFDPKKTNNINVLKHFASGMTEVRILDDSKITYHMLAVDDKKVAFSFKDLKTGRVKSGMIVEDEDIAKGTRDYFDHLWNQAIPSEKIIEKEAKKALEMIK